MRSPERPPFPHTSSQMKNGPNYHFNLGLLSANDPLDTKYKKPPKVFQPIQQTLTMEGHHPFQ